VNRNGSPHHWQLLDRIVQQISIQQLDGSDPDIQFLRDFNVESCVKLLIDEFEMRKLKETAEMLRKKQEEMKTQLTRKERECGTKMKEKEDLMKSFNILKNKFEVETRARQNLEQRLNDVINQSDELRQSPSANQLKGLESKRYHGDGDDVMLNKEQEEKKKLESLISSNKPPTSKSSSSSLPIPPPPPIAPIPIPPPIGIPPPPPGIPGVPPPPPPPPVGLLTTKRPPKKGPKPKNPLKSFNWSKLPESKLEGTIWNDLDDAKIYEMIDLSSLDHNFSAYQRQQVSLLLL